MKNRLFASGLCVAALLAAGCSQGHRILVKDENRGFLITGVRNSPDDPFGVALNKAYEQCGGTKTKDGKHINIDFDVSTSLPVWTEEEGWHYSNVECLDTGQGERVYPTGS